jgi:hypothetical protein
MERFALPSKLRGGEEPPEDGYQGASSRAAAAGDLVEEMPHSIEASLERPVHFDSWARQSVLEERLPELLPGSTRTSGRALVGAIVGVRRRGDRVLIRSDGGRRPTGRQTSCISSTSSNAASIAPSTS